jgi:hypothetical protein
MSEKTEFEFPDEIEEKESRKGSRVVEADSLDTNSEPDNDEIEVVDDTPEEDRGRKPMDSPPEDPTDEELNSVSSKVRDRTREFHKAYHDERRNKEAALRERERAVEIAKSLYEETSASKARLTKTKTPSLKLPRSNWQNKLKMPRESTSKPMNQVTQMLWLRRRMS